MREEVRENAQTEPFLEDRAVGPKDTFHIEDEHASAEEKTSKFWLGVFVAAGIGLLLLAMRYFA